MTITVAMLRTAGVTAEQIVRVLELEQSERLAARREQNRINKRNQRSRQHVSADSADNPPPPKETSPTPPKEISPLPPKPSLTSFGRGARLPEDWKPSQPDIEFARNLIGESWHLEQDKFRDHWLAKAGADARKVSWSLTWRNWVRRAHEFAPPAKKQNGASVFKSNTLLDLWDDRRSKAP